MSTVLITGAKGQLGREIYALKEKCPKLQLFFAGKEELTIADRSAIENFVTQNRINYIVNCAAYTAVDKAETEKESAFTLNAIGPKFLAEVAAQHSARLIHISTDYVFDGTSYFPYTEEHPTKSASVYGETKLQGEINVQRANPDSIIIRTSWLYSSFGNNFVKTMIRLGREKDELGIIFDQVGSPTYAKDLAVAILHILEQSEQDPSNFTPGLYHYTNEGVCSWYDFAKSIHKLAGIHCIVNPIETREYPTPAKRPHYSVLNKNKIKSTFGLSIPHWEESLKNCISALDRLLRN